MERIKNVVNKVAMLVLLSVPGLAFCQYKIDQPKIDETLFASAIIQTEETIYTPLEKQAEFPGGIEKFYQYLYKNMDPSKKARRKAAAGKIFVAFTINTDGSIEDETVQVLSPNELGLASVETISDHDFKREAIRVIKECPDWLPAQQENHPIKQRLVLPIVCR